MNITIQHTHSAHSWKHDERMKVNKLNATKFIIHYQLIVPRPYNCIHNNGNNDSPKQMGSIVDSNFTRIYVVSLFLCHSVGIGIRVLMETHSATVVIDRNKIHHGKFDCVISYFRHFNRSFNHDRNITTSVHFGMGFFSLFCYAFSTDEHDADAESRWHTIVQSILRCSL